MDTFTFWDLCKISVNVIHLHRNAPCLLTTLLCRLCELHLLATADSAHVDGAGDRHAVVCSVPTKL